MGYRDETPVRQPEWVAGTTVKTHGTDEKIAQGTGAPDCSVTHLAHSHRIPAMQLEHLRERDPLRARRTCGVHTAGSEIRLECPDVRRVGALSSAKTHTQTCEVNAADLWSESCTRTRTHICTEEKKSYRGAYVRNEFLLGPHTACCTYVLLKTMLSDASFSRLGALMP